jgi:hypothetical protein
VKPWAVAGLPLLGRDIRAWAIAAACQVVWLPFVIDILAGDVQQATQAGSPLRPLLGVAQSVPTWWRGAQLLAIVVAAAVCVAVRRVDAALTVALCVRMLLDPGDFDYYPASVALVALTLGRMRAAVIVVLGLDALLLSQEYAAPATAVASAWLTVVAAALCFGPLQGHDRGLRQRLAVLPHPVVRAAP